MQRRIRTRQFFGRKIENRGKTTLHQTATTIQTSCCFNQNSDLIAEARRAKLYRDEVDAMRERAERADKLELEVQRYRERLADAEFYKVRVDELREDNRVLLETREMLEAQLARARQRADHVLQLEAEILECKQNINDIVLVWFKYIYNYSF